MAPCGTFPCARKERRRGPRVRGSHSCKCRIHYASFTATTLSCLHAHHSHEKMRVLIITCIGQLSSKRDSSSMAGEPTLLVTTRAYITIEIEYKWFTEPNANAEQPPLPTPLETIPESADAISAWCQSCETFVRKCGPHRPFQCPRCPRRFASRNGLQIHNGRLHPTVKETKNNVLLRCRWCHASGFSATLLEKHWQFHYREWDAARHFSLLSRAIWDSVLINT